MITFEGIDGVGKSTHVKFVYDLLKSSGRDIVLMREPGGNEISESIRNVVLNKKFEDMRDETELFLYLAARSQTVADDMLPLLESGYIVLCDRFIDSTVAYQGYGRGLDIDFIVQACNFATKGLCPDKTIVFTIPEDERIRRLSRREGQDRLELQSIEFKMRVASGFEKIAQDERERVDLIDTSGKHSATAKKVISSISPIVELNLDQEYLAELLSKFDAAHTHRNDD